MGIGQTRDNSNTRFFYTKMEHIYMRSYVIPVVYIRRVVSCLKEFTLFYHCPHTGGVHMSREIY